MIRKEIHKKMQPHGRRCGSSKRMSGKKRSAFFLCRTKSRRMKEQNRKWKHNFKACRRCRKEDAATPPKRLVAAWQSSWALWDRQGRCIISRICAGCSTECSRLRPHRSKFQQKKKDSRGIQRPKGVMKAFQQLLVLILLGFQRQGVKSEPQETSRISKKIAF